LTSLPGGGPNEVFRDYSPGSPTGVPTDPQEHVAPDSMESRARSALTLGLLSIPLSFVTGIPAIWVGSKALQHINAADGDLKGRWAAWTGIALGILSVIVAVVVFVYLHEHPSSHTPPPSTHG
jgi:hypothetical protein